MTKEPNVQKNWEQTMMIFLIIGHLINNGVPKDFRTDNGTMFAIGLLKQYYIENN